MSASSAVAIQNREQRNVRLRNYVFGHRIDCRRLGVRTCRGHGVRSGKDLLLRLPRTCSSFPVEWSANKRQLTTQDAARTNDLVRSLVAAYVHFEGELK